MNFSALKSLKTPTQTMTDFFAVGIIVLLVLFLGIFNYQPETFLTGWDNLHPEFNLGLSLKRSFFTAWQEYQGLGLLGGMGHGADLFRQLLLWIFSLVLPVFTLRYVYQFLMLLSGPLGVYFLLQRLVFRKEKFLVSTVAGLGGGLFYLFNLATLQMFYVPFEVYSAHFGFLPWLFLTAWLFLTQGTRKTFGAFLLVNLLALTQGYVITFFLVYFAALVLLFFGYYWLKRLGLGRIFVLLLTTIFLNSFWLLPNLYFVFSQAEVPLQAKINLMSTEENLLQNRKYGNLSNLALLKGFWFDNLAPGQAQEYLLEPWVAHLQKSFAVLAGYLLFGLALLGVGVSIGKKSNPGLAFLPVLFLCLVFLGSEIPILSFFNRLFYRLPWVSQVFRFPFTKFSLLLAFCLSLFYGLAIFFLVKTTKSKVLSGLVSLLLLFLPVFYLWPVFQGNLFYRYQKVRIPEEYFQVFDFFKSQDPNSRIANFPQVNYWGWTTYHWGYSGSGILWYGIQQPILDRAFDVWGSQNENYYWEVSYALYSKNKALFEKVLEKYQVNWVLVDANVTNASDYRALGFDELEELLASEKFELAAELGKIKIYKVNLERPAKDFVFLAQALPTVGPAYSWTNYDQAYFEIGDYISHQPDSRQLPVVFYPFRSLFTGRSPQELDFEISETPESYLFRQKLPSGLANYQLQLPALDSQALVWLNPADLGKARYFIPQAWYQGEEVIARIPKVGGYFSARVEGKGQDFLFASTNSAKKSTSFGFPQLPHQFGYLLKVENKNLSGRSLLFWLENQSSRRVDMELYLPRLNTYYLIQPPMKKDGLGYSLHFDNIAIGWQESANNLREITVEPIPYEFLVGIKLVAKDKALLSGQLLPARQVKHPNPSFYEVKLDKVPENSTLVLSQSYHSGWAAYALEDKGYPGQVFLAPILGEKLGEQVLVNNWQNGWQVDKTKIANPQLTKIFLVFLPQYLQYLGFGLGVLPLGVLFWLRQHQKPL